MTKKNLSDWSLTKMMCLDEMDPAKIQKTIYSVIKRLDENPKKFYN